MNKGSVYIGTSGWMYRHWSGNFYPGDLVQKEWFRFYSQHFNTVEVNSSFYGQTKASTFEKWKSEVTPNFTFAIKGNRYITHIKRLKDTKDSVDKFFENTKPLTIHQSRIANHHVILWQLPPSLKVDIERLDAFINLLPKSFRYAFEFRHKTWVHEKVIDVLVNSKISSTVVFQDWKDWPITADYTGWVGFRGLEKLPFIYVRFHGRDQLYTSGYSDEELAQWSEKMQKWVKSGLDVYAYFNNDAMGYAPKNAETLARLLK